MGGGKEKRRGGEKDEKKGFDGLGEVSPFGYSLRGGGNGGGGDVRKKKEKKGSS